MPYDGNCHFHAVSIHTAGEGTILRKYILDFLISETPERLSTDLQMAIDEPLLANLRQPSAAIIDDTICKAVAEYTCRDVIVIPYDPDHATPTATTSTFTHGSESTTMQPIVLGHFKDSHFVPLKSAAIKRKSHKITTVVGKRPATMTDFFSKARTQSSSHDTHDETTTVEYRIRSQTTSVAHLEDTEDPTAPTNGSPSPSQAACSPSSESITLETKNSQNRHEHLLRSAINVRTERFRQNGTPTIHG